jgi:hypothetical protein
MFLVSFLPLVLALRQAPQILWLGHHLLLLLLLV